MRARLSMDEVDSECLCEPAYSILIFVLFGWFNIRPSSFPSPLGVGTLSLATDCALRAASFAIKPNSSPPCCPCQFRSRCCFCAFPLRHADPLQTDTFRILGLVYHLWQFYSPSTLPILIHGCHRLVLHHTHKFTLSKPRSPGSVPTAVLIILTYHRLLGW
jgi:hypothetical protein